MKIKLGNFSKRFYVHFRSLFVLKKFNFSKGNTRAFECFKFYHPRLTIVFAFHYENS